jgi:hypothetical protein
MIWLFEFEKSIYGKNRATSNRIKPRYLLIKPLLSIFKNDSSEGVKELDSFYRTTTYGLVPVDEGEADRRSR